MQWCVSVLVTLVDLKVKFVAEIGNDVSIVVHCSFVHHRETRFSPMFNICAQRQKIPEDLILALVQ